MSKPRKRPFGNITKLKSGNFRARYHVDRGTYIGNAVFPTRREAEDWLVGEHWRLISQEGMPQSPTLRRPSMPLGEYVRTHVKHHLEMKDSTRSANYALIDRYLDPQDRTPSANHPYPDLGSVLLKDLTPEQLRLWLNWVEERAAATAEGRRPKPGTPRWTRALRILARKHGIRVGDTGKLPVAAHELWEELGRPELCPPAEGSQAGRAVRRQCYSMVSAALNSAVCDGLLSANPCKLKGASTIQRSHRPVLEGLPALRALAQDVPDRYRFAVLLAGVCTLRAGEQFALTRRDVDLELGRIYVRRTLTRKKLGSASNFGPPKSAAARRWVPIPEIIRPDLQHHLERFTGADPDDLVFCTSSGRPVPSSRRTFMFKRAADKHGRPDLRWHDLRHTAATWAARSGATLAELKFMLGHTTTRASEIYLHASEQSVSHVGQRLSDFLKST
jgi:integrase